MSVSYGENFVSSMIDNIDRMLDKYEGKNVARIVEKRERITPPKFTRTSWDNYMEQKDLPRDVRRIIEAVAKETKLRPRQLLYQRYNGRQPEEKRGHSLLIYFLRYEMEATFPQISTWVDQEAGHLSKIMTSFRKERHEDSELDKLITLISLRLCNR